MSTRWNAGNGLCCSLGFALILIFLIIGVASASTPTVAPTADGLAKLDDWIAAHMEEKTSPGHSLQWP